MADYGESSSKKIMPRLAPLLRRHSITPAQQEQGPKVSTTLCLQCVPFLLTSHKARTPGKTSGSRFCSRLAAYLRGGVNFGWFAIIAAMELPPRVAQYATPAAGDLEG